MPIAMPGRGPAFLLAAALAAAIVPGAAAQVPVASAPPFDAQLRALGDPGSLAFLRRLEALPAINPQLAGSITRRLEGAAGGGAGALAEAERDIRARLTADAIANGNGLSAPLAARSLGLSLGREPGAARAWRETLGIAATADDARLAAMGFDRLLRPADLESLLVAAMTQQLVGGGTVVWGGGNVPPVQPTQPPGRPAPLVTPVGANPAGTAVMQSAPGSAVLVGGGRLASQRTLQCERSFEGLQGRYDAATGRRTEPFDPSEFREVLLIAIRDRDGNEGGTCTGTLIAGRWVLTAAHCVMFQNQPNGQPRLELSTASVTGVRGQDLNEPLAEHLQPEARRLSTDPNGTFRSFRVVRAIVHHAYDPAEQRASVFSRGRLPYSNDVALLELHADASDGISATPAVLGQPSALTSPVTVAGYGVSTDDPHRAGSLNVGWSLTPQGSGSFLQVSYSTNLEQDGQARICPGDSGGPVFAGRHRGCRAQVQWPHVATEAPRPRVILGVHSHIENDRRDDEIDGTECGRARWNRMVDVTAPAMREWICSRTGGAAGGCSP